MTQKNKHKWNKILIERDRKNLLVDPDQIVSGDIVFIKTGDIVPCDMLIMNHFNCVLDISVL